nr:MAG TPA: NUMOD3 motif protein [Caudoviricetes sp.]
MQGVKKSEETKRRMSEAVRKRYIEKPESFVKPTLNKLAITDGNITKYIEKDQ